MSENYNYFMDADVSGYIGEWIFLIGGNIVFHGNDIKEGYKDVKEKYPGNKISIARVPDETSCIF